jgi:hypothetical protein
MKYVHYCIMLFFLALMVSIPSVRAVADDNVPAQKEGDTTPKTKEERTKDIACDCCMKCRAAQKPVSGKEEGPPAKNGCRDCCEKCGRKLPLDPQFPPEKVPELK